MNPTRRHFVLAFALLPWAGFAQAETSASDLLAAVSGPEATQALRESLEQGARKAISTLGRENGFLGDPSVKIGLPKNFTRAEKFLRGVGYGQKIDDLILAMNRAAETATPKAQELLLESIRKMSISDAKTVLTGGDNAATEYFRKSTEAQLTETLMPVVRSMTEKSDFVRAYNGLAGKLVKYGVKSDQQTIERYVNKKALDGIYFRIGEEERNLRANPTRYAGSLLGKVFGLMK
jgi:hypothetical protein